MPTFTALKPNFEKKQQKKNRERRHEADISM